MKKNKKILFTFDYELGLGKQSGSLEKNILYPTSQIKKILKKYNLTAIFFVDTTYLLTLQKHSKDFLNVEKDFDKIKRQIISLAKDGHYIYHHIHPHWLDAVYIKELNQWDLTNQTKFSLSNLNKKEANLLFKKSKYLLESILKGVKNFKKIEGFRAGGLFIQPFNEIKIHFENNNIKYDFSVLNGATCYNKEYQFDFTNFNKNDIYRINDNVLINDPKGKFVEISMNQIELKNFYKILNGIHYRIFKNFKSYLKYGDGMASTNKIVGVKKKSNKFSTFETISIEMLNPIRTLLYYNHIQNNDFIHFISHPKLLSKKSIYYYEKLIKKINKTHTITTDLHYILKNYL